MRLPKWGRVVLPPLVLLVSIVLTGTIIALRPEQEKKEPVPMHPKVEIFAISEEPIRVTVESQGSVRPLQQTRLTARVSGQIEQVSPNFYEGGIFSTGDMLLKLDPLPYQSALAEARSRLALAESALLQEQEAAEQAHRDWDKVGTGEPSPLVLRIPQLDKAKADLEAAEVAVEMATRNLAYTEIRAPYDGRVLTNFVDVGQAITAQVTVLADIFSIDAMEVPLPLSLDDLAFIEKGEDKPAVRLSARIAGSGHDWIGYLDRTAASVDAATRMITAYARIEPPYISANGAILKPGMFVDAGIEGQLIRGAVRLPRGAIQPGSITYRLDTDNRLEAVRVEILRTDSKWALVTSELAAGDRICLTPLLFFVEGMQVEPVVESSGAVDRKTEPQP
jgi:RND family efflux transporter MFP subunit